MTLNKGIAFKNDTCAAIEARGWLHSDGDTARYDVAIGR